MNWEIEIGIYTLSWVKQVPRRSLVYSKGNSAWCSVVTSMGGERVTEYEMVGWQHRHNGHEFEQILGDSEGEGSLA